MGQSTDGQICYGIQFEEGFEFPWGDTDIDDWWVYDVLGFKPSVQLYDNDGEYLNGVEPSKELVSKYFDEKRAIQESNPFPFELVNYCSGDYPSYILAIKRTSMTANRGYPITFDPTTLTVSKEEIESLIDFCHKHGILCESEPNWYLSSYLG